MSFIDLFIWFTLAGLIIYNLMLLKRVRIIFKSYPSIYDYSILIVSAVFLLVLATFFVISLVLVFA